MSVAALAPSEPTPRPLVRATLSDGRQVVIRRLGPADSAALTAAVAEADPIDLRRRFMGQPPATAVLIRQLAGADGVHDYGLGAFDDDGRLVGVAQFDREDDEPSAELGIEVATDWQRRGLGRRLLLELSDVARMVGITHLTATYYADNIPVRRLLHASGRVVASGVNQGEGYAVLRLVDR